MNLLFVDYNALGAQDAKYRANLDKLQLTKSWFENNECTLMSELWTVQRIGLSSTVLCLNANMTSSLGLFFNEYNSRVKIVSFQHHLSSLISDYPI